VIPFDVYFPPDQTIKKLADRLGAEDATGLKKGTTRCATTQNSCATIVSNIA
jgi:hypothetical protein